jgi:hypothetical protein
MPSRIKKIGFQNVFVLIENRMKQDRISLIIFGEFAECFFLFRGGKNGNCFFPECLRYHSH